jgi:hypothetical protein
MDPKPPPPAAQGKARKLADGTQEAEGYASGEGAVVATGLVKAEATGGVAAAISLGTAIANAVNLTKNAEAKVALEDYVKKRDLEFSPLRSAEADQLLKTCLEEAAALKETASAVVTEVWFNSVATKIGLAIESVAKVVWPTVKAIVTSGVVAQVVALLKA